MGFEGGRAKALNASYDVDLIGYAGEAQLA
jgi:hypothetical protein